MWGVFARRKEWDEKKPTRLLHKLWEEKLSR